ncbi:hypothetical protein BH10PSE17_BH10PSE17_05630 [soil metagenome]
MEFGQLFHILKARWRMIGICVASVLLIAVVYRLAVPASYLAVASVIVDPRGINPVSGLSTQDSMAQSSVIGTYANIARSEGIARRVATKLPDGLRDRLREAWLRKHDPDEPGFENFAARLLMKQVDVRAGGQSSHVLDVSFANRSAGDAAQVANAYADALIDYSREMRIGSARKDADYFQVESGTLKKQTEEAEQKLAAFQRQNGITSNDDRIDVETARLAALNSQVVINQDLSYEMSSKARQTAASTELVTNQLIQSLTTTVATKEAAVRDLARKFGDDHPELILARAQAEEARQVLARESSRIQASLSTSSAVARSRSDSLRADSEKQRQKVVELNALRVELTSLTRDVEQKRKLYEAAVQRSSETGLEAGSQRQDLMLLTEAIAPDTRTGPGAAILLPLAAIVGIMLGTMAAIILDRARPRVHRLVDFEELGIPVLQVVPVVQLAGNGGQGPRLLGAT